MVLILIVNAFLMTLVELSFDLGVTLDLPIRLLYALF